MSSHCRHLSSLSTYADGELATSDVRWLEDHLTGCGECRQELQNLQKLQGLLRRGLQGVRPEMPGTLWPGVLARIQGRRPQGLIATWTRQIWEAGWERPRLSLAGATLMVFLLLSVAYVNWQTPVGGPPGGTPSLGLGKNGVVVDAVEPEPGFRAMVLTTSERGLKVIWVVPQGRI